VPDAAAMKGIRFAQMPDRSSLKGTTVLSDGALRGRAAHAAHRHSTSQTYGSVRAPRREATSSAAVRSCASATFTPRMDYRVKSFFESRDSAEQPFWWCSW
jgi:hypothetical protein